MTPDAATAAFMAHLRETAALGQAAGVLMWDQETSMPAKGAAARAEQMAALQGAIHARRADPRIPDWADAMGKDLSPVERVSRAEALRAHARAVRIPDGLSAALARETSAAHPVWIGAKVAARFADFAPALTRILALKREEASCLADGADLYDPLLRDYEPDMTTAEVAALFDALRPPLVALRARLADRPAPPLPHGDFPPEAQLALSRELATLFGYDWAAGRLDLAEHPFSSGQGGDVRITTRIDPASPFENIFATIHETGHAVYEQGIDPALAFTPAGTEASMGIHESQSRLFENQIGRSLPFCRWLFPRLEAHFGDVGLAAPEDLWRAVNRVETGFRRTEADEVHYNLHVMLRFDLERALISGDLAPGDLEAAWNDRFEADFGLKVPDAARGVLQDVHWSAGLFGYFPTYTIGNIAAGCLHAAMLADLPEVEAGIAAGDLSAPLGWLHERIHRQGRLLPAPELIRRATGAPPTPGPLLDYLDTKFRALYGP